MLTKQMIVVSMGSEPESYERVDRFDGKSVVSADPDRPEAANLLEMEGRVTRVLL